MEKQHWKIEFYSADEVIINENYAKFDIIPRKQDIIKFNNKFYSVTSIIYNFDNYSIRIEINYLYTIKDV